MLVKSVITHIQGVSQLPPEGVYYPLNYYIEKTFRYGESGRIELKEQNYHNYCNQGLYYKTEKEMAEVKERNWAIPCDSTYLHQPNREMFVDSEGNIFTGIVDNGAIIWASAKMLYRGETLDIVSTHSWGLNPVFKMVK